MKENQKRFWVLLARHLKFEPTDLAQWYNWSLYDLSVILDGMHSPELPLLANVCIARLDWLKRGYNSNLAKALAVTYPDHNWQPWLFASVPAGYWDDPTTHRLYFDWLRDQLRIPLSELHMLYDVTVDHVYQHRGRSLLRTYYGSSLPFAMIRVYPEHKWQVWRFNQSRVPRGFWSDPACQRQYFESLTHELDADSSKGLALWYSWTANRLEKFRPESANVVRSYFGGNLPQALAAAFPEHAWDEAQFQASSRSFSQ